MSASPLTTVGLNLRKHTSPIPFRAFILTTNLILILSLFTTPNLKTAVFATWISPYTFYLVYLSSNVSAIRRKYLTPVGQFINPIKKKDDNTPTAPQQFDPRNPDPLFIAVRCHANYVEVIPWCLGLAALAEINGGDKTVLNVALGVLFASRVAHV